MGKGGNQHAPAGKSATTSSIEVQKLHDQLTDHSTKYGKYHRTLANHPPKEYRGVISMEEVAKHTSVDDCWMVLKGKVYDVSNWREHPGGNVIFSNAGGDMTDVFAAFHPGTAYNMLSNFLIGEIPNEKQRIDDASSGQLEFIDKSEEQKRFEKGYRDLRTKLVMGGMFKANLLYYVRKMMEVIGLVTLSWALLHFTSEQSVLAAKFFPSMEQRPIWIELLSACILALFWQQCGWLAHDFLHHQVFKNRTLGDMAGILVGNIFQGFSVGWWKDKHNTHHAVPNLVGDDEDAHDGDPDIDTMPLLAWSMKMARKAEATWLGQYMVTNQATFYFPILLVARIKWLLDSFLFNFFVESYKTQAFGYKALEKVGLLIHYLWYGSLMFCYMSPTRVLLYFMTSQCMTGLLLAIVFGLGHNGMSVYDSEKRPDFWKLQVTTTRNVKGGSFVQWFCGGLGYQVDHHLFPTLPRHNLGQVHELVESFCKEYNVQYHETTMWDGTIEVLQHLGEVSQEFVKDFPGL